MSKFEKGNKVSPGRKKGSKNRVTLLFAGLTEENKEIIFQAAMKLVKKGNVTIINKFLDKIFPNAMIKDEAGNYVIPQITFNVIDNQSST